VVIAIIGILLSLTAGAVYRIMGNQQEANTKTFLRSINSNLKKQWTDVYNSALKEQDAEYNAVKSTLLTNAGNNPERARVIYAKLCLQRAFPMTIQEALTGPAPGVMLPYSGYVQYLKSIGITKSIGAPTAFESSACLLMAMQVGPKHTGVRIEDFGAGTVGTENYGSASVRYFKDGWGNPFFFCRWPTAADKLNPGGNPQNGLHDTGDPKGLLNGSDWALTTSAGFIWFTKTVPIHNLPTRAGVNSQATSYTLTPLLVSPGPDGKLGIGLLPTQGGQTATAADITDNLYNVDVQ
jgi:hypothetical protein